MRSFAIVSLIAGLGLALPQDATNCATVTTEVIVPTSTVTYTTTGVTTVHATTAKDLGTFTLVVRESSTKMLETLTSTTTACMANGTISASAVTATKYTTSGAAASGRAASGLAASGAAAASLANATFAAAPTAYSKRALGLYPRQDACTVTSTFTTSYGQTYTFIAAVDAASTFTDYTAFSQATVTSTSYGGTAYAIATATARAEAVCGPTLNVTRFTNTTVTMDARCKPAVLTSAYDGYGFGYADAVPGSGASYKTTTGDASQCCQLCAEAESCAASTWDIRTGDCELGFPVDAKSGNMNCGKGFLVYYDAGPNNPMAPGAGLFVGTMCGNVQFVSAAPDNGT